MDQVRTVNRKERAEHYPPLISRSVEINLELRKLTGHFISGAVLLFGHCTGTTGRLLFTRLEVLGLYYRRLFCALW